MKLLILWLNVLATGETELDLNTGKKYSLINHLTYCSSEKKKIIQTFNYSSRLFPSLENCWANSRPFREFKTTYEPDI